MKIDLQQNFCLELLLCMAISDIKFTEYNELTTASRRLISFEFPDEIKPDLHDVCKLIVGFRVHSHKSSEFFLRAFARKDPDRFRELAIDQMKPRHYRQYDVGNMTNPVIAVATLYGIDCTEKII